MEIRITNISYNTSYDAEKCNNGGGYLQPSCSGFVTNDEGVKIPFSLDDTSCGDFGSRYQFKIGLYRPFVFRFGTMDDKSNEVFYIDECSNYADAETKLNINISQVFDKIVEKTCEVINEMF